MEKNIVGRKNEKEILKQVIKSPNAQFLAIYGRRRVGKTHLIREFFEDKGIVLELTGQKNAKLRTQLNNCYRAIREAFKPIVPPKVPESWNAALSLITQFIELQPNNKKIILFFDELPWLASKRSGLLQSIDYEWNHKWSKYNNLVLITCGSAASWVIEKLINAKGGLYNRITKIIHLQPFNLVDSEIYLKSRGIKLNRYQLIELYMVIGGIPHYLNLLDSGNSSTQIINNLCFQESGYMFSEFPRLFSSLFDHADDHQKIIRAIAKKRYGISRKELLETIGAKSGGTFRKRLDELIASGFIGEYVPYGKRKNYYHLKIIDEYTLFYLHWIEPIKKEISSGYIPNYWLNAFKEPKYRTWTGYAFEAVCMKHISQIISSLELNQLSLKIGCWRYQTPAKSKEKGAQIDLLIDRSDNSINLCEIKYTNKIYTISKDYAQNLVNKITLFEKYAKTKKQIFLTMITTKGIKKNIWSEDLVANEVILDDIYN